MNDILKWVLENGLEVKFSAKMDYDRPENSRFIVYITNSKGSICTRRAASIEELETSLLRALLAEGAAAWGRIKTTEDPESGDLIHEMST